MNEEERVHAQLHALKQMACLKKYGKLSYSAAMCLWYLRTEAALYDVSPEFDSTPDWALWHTLSDLARILGVRQPNMSRLVRRLTKLGYVHAVPDPHSKVRRHIGLTRRGKMLVKRALQDAEMRGGAV